MILSDVVLDLILGIGLYQKGRTKILSLEEGNKMGGWSKYVRTGYTEMRPYIEGENLDGVSISKQDRLRGSPRVGDMIARNPKNHKDMWLVAEKYFKDNLAQMEADTIVENWLKNPKPSKFIEEWLVVELKRLSKRNQYMSAIGDIVIKYELQWNTSKTSDFSNIHFSSDNEDYHAICSFLNGCDEPLLCDLAKEIVGQPILDNDIRYVCRVSDILEEIDPDYSWHDTMRKACL